MVLPEKMDRRSWLWRRKSSEKSPGETESSGGSISPHSERFSDDQVYLNHNSQVHEVTSKPKLHQDERENGINALSERLSAALLSISAKEELVKQHAKVAEEAVSGWEKAESEVLALKQQIEALTLRNSTLEDRVGHLDGALKECLRQLRQTREENEHKVHETIEKKTSEWQITKTHLENQLAAAKTAAQPHPNLEILEKQNSALKLQLSSMAEELEIRLIERELSNKSAEEACKLHLDSVKKAAKLESECHRLKSTLQKALNGKDHGSFFNGGNLKEPSKFERKRIAPTVEIDLMDDFLEMERLVALPENDQSLGGKTELEAMANRRSKVEERLKEVETEKGKLENVLKERENELRALKTQFENTESKLVEMGNMLNTSNGAREVAKKELQSTKEAVEKAEMEVVEVKSQLEAAYARKEEAESRNETLEKEIESLARKVESLESEVHKERSVSRDVGAKSQQLEDEISRLRHEIQYPKASKRTAELRMKQEAELAMAGSKFVECQKTIASLSRQLRTLATLDDFVINPSDSVEVT